MGGDGLLVGSLRDHDAARRRGRRRRPAGSRDAAARGDNGRERYSEQTNLHVPRTTPASASSRSGWQSSLVLPPEFTPEGIGLAALIASGTRDGIAILGPDGKLVFWNSAAAAITGWSLAQAAEKSLGNLVKGPEALVEIRDGMWVELRYTRVDANGQTFLILMFTDSTSLMSLRNARHQLRSLGLIDEITGLPGRDLALVQLDQAIALARRDKRSVGLLTVKVDHF